MTMTDKLPIVDAYEDPDWDGVWAKCPHCEHENGVTWSGEKECSQCEVIFTVADSSLVKQRDQSSGLRVFRGPGGQLFYDGKDISFP